MHHRLILLLILLCSPLPAAAQGVPSPQGEVPPPPSVQTVTEAQTEAAAQRGTEAQATDGDADEGGETEAEASAAAGGAEAPVPSEQTGASAQPLPPVPPAPTQAPPPPPPVTQTVVVHAATPAASPMVETRSRAYVAENYINGAIWGGTTALTVFTGSGAPANWVVQSGILGAGVGAGVSYLLSDVMTPSSAAAETTGHAIGVLNGMLLPYALTRGDTMGRRTRAWTFAAVNTAGTAAGLLIGTTAKPKVGDSRLVMSASLWGMMLGTYAMMHKSADATELSATIGLNVGALGGVLAASLVDLSPGRAMLLNAGFAVGSAAGALLSNAAALREDEFGPPMITGAIAGTVVTCLLTGLFAEDDRDDPAADQTQAFVSTTEHGGLTAGFAGAF